MRFENVSIRAFSYHLPETIVSSQNIEERLSELYSRLKLPEGRLELMTGIQERRTWPKGTLPSSLSTSAATKLIEENNIDKNEIDLLIHASVCRDFLEPATASVVHNNIGLSEECSFFDLSNACLGVINAMVVASTMIEKGLCKNILIVSGENAGPLLDSTISELLNDKTITRKTVKKYISNLTIGSAAVAYLISHSSQCPDAPQILGGAQLTDSSANVLCRGDGSPDSLTMETDSEQLLKVGLKLAQKTWKKAKSNLNWDQGTDHWVFTHQVGKAHEDSLSMALEIKGKKTFNTYPFLGNTGSAALPITLAMAADKIKKGDYLALLGIGSGISSIMLGVKW